MSIETIKNAIPDYAKDLKLNISSLAFDETLTTQQLWGTFLASAIASRNEFIIQNVEAEAKEKTVSRSIGRRKSRRRNYGDEQYLLPLRPFGIQQGIPNHASQATHECHW